MSITVTLELPDAGSGQDFARADLTVYGLDHSGPSYQVLIFFDNPKGDDTTEPSAANGYVTRFAVFGHGGCFGEEGHCDVVGPINDFDRNHPHQLEPATRIVTVTEAVQRAVGAGQASVVVTLVPVVRDSALAASTMAASVSTVDQVALHIYA